MAIAEDASTPASVTTQFTSSTTVTTASFTPPSGSLLVVLCSYAASSGATSPTLTPSSTGLTFTQLAFKASSSGDQYAGIWVADVPSTGARTVTVTRNVSGFAGNLLSVRVLTGAAAAASQTGAVVDTTQSTGVVKATLTPTQLGSEVYVQATIDTGPGTFTAVSGTTLISENNDGSDLCHMATGKSTSTVSSLVSTDYGWTQGAGALPTVTQAVEILVAPAGPAPLTDDASGADDLSRTIAAPTGLTATPVGTTQLDLSWDAVPGASGYDIERDGSVIVSGHGTTSYSDTGLTADTDYDYRVRAIVVV